MGPFKNCVVLNGIWDQSSGWVQNGRGSKVLSLQKTRGGCGDKVVAILKGWEGGLQKVLM